MLTVWHRTWTMRTHKTLDRAHTLQDSVILKLFPAVCPSCWGLMRTGLPGSPLCHQGLCAPGHTSTPRSPGVWLHSFLVSSMVHRLLPSSCASQTLRNSPQVPSLLWDRPSGPSQNLRPLTVPVAGSNLSLALSSPHFTLGSCPAAVSAPFTKQLGRG